MKKTTVCCLIVALCLAACGVKSDLARDPSYPRDYPVY
jgi:hypothetical protein